MHNKKTHVQCIKKKIRGKKVYIQYSKSKNQQPEENRNFKIYER